MPRFTVAVSTAIFLFLLTSIHAEPTSQTDAKLGRWLKQYPIADANKDGILTQTEARQFAQKLQKLKGDSRSKLTPTKADLPYGLHARQKLDFYQAKSDRPTPVLICFHGGGFVGGDKGIYSKNPMAAEALAAGISVVSANYRFVKYRDGSPGDPYPAAMHDGARVIQFVRHHAEKLNIDPDRIALTGGSAGACMSIWLATHDDLAEPDGKDLIARQSTRVSCVLSFGGQTTLDPKIIIKKIGGGADMHPSLMPFYAISSLDELETPAVRQKIEDASALNRITRDDPPIYMAYNGKLAGTPLHERTSPGVVIHHPMFGKMLKDKYDALGLESHLLCADQQAEIEPMVFVKKHLGIK